MNSQYSQSVRAREPGQEPLTVQDRMTTHPVFVVDDSFFRSRTPKPVHWSIAWSDLMMTMFILFLCLFVYQLAHRQFLSRDEPETVAGSTIPVPLPETGSRPIVPIFPTVSQDKRDVIKKIESVTPRDEEVERMFAGQPAPLHDKPLETVSRKPDQGTEPVTEPGMEKPPLETQAQRAGQEHEVTELPLPLGQESVLDKQTGSTSPDQAATDQGVTDSAEPGEIISEIFDLSRQTLTEENLEKFARVELIPDKAMRIVLTGDLLFASGRAELNDQARSSLRKLAGVIRQTPYLIHVIGHTDSVPMSSPRYPTNWELSTARASRVARFLIEEMQVPGKQIIVSGCSYFRPVRPNTTVADRRANRRVEIILSREEVPATATGNIL